MVWSRLVPSNSKFGNAGGVRYWLALSQTWDREEETQLFISAPLLPELGEEVGG
jgi:hypothetical protein